MALTSAVGAAGAAGAAAPDAAAAASGAAAAAVAAAAPAAAAAVASSLVSRPAAGLGGPPLAGRLSLHPAVAVSPETVVCLSLQLEGRPCNAAAAGTAAAAAAAAAGTAAAGGAAGGVGAGYTAGFCCERVVVPDAAVLLQQVLLLGSGEQLHPLLRLPAAVSIPSPRAAKLRVFVRVLQQESPPVFMELQQRLPPGCAAAAAAQHDQQQQQQQQQQQEWVSFMPPFCINAPLSVI